MADSTVLVVDDDPVILKLLEVNFEMEGFTVLVARDGEEGIEVARADQPDLIVSDIMMPKVSGLELVTALKGDPSTSEIPIILLSAKAQNADVRSGLDAVPTTTSRSRSSRSISSTASTVCSRPAPRSDPPDLGREPSVIRDVLEKSLRDALAAVGIDAPAAIHLERPARREHGDWSSNVAMATAKPPAATHVSLRQRSSTR